MQALLFLVGAGLLVSLSVGGIIAAGAAAELYREW